MNLVSSNIKSLSDEKIRKAFSRFLAREESDKRSYLQNEFGSPFTGYSYLGQEDSLNQYPEDGLHSFVLSDYSPIDKLPPEFQSFMKNDWEAVKQAVQEFELNSIESLRLSAAHEFVRFKLGYMLSCNYYPPKSGLKDPSKKVRIAKHKDVSFLSTFPFGLEPGLVLHHRNGALKVGKKQHPISFPGYLMETMTGQKILAAEHEVQIDHDKARFSFSVFSIPKPGSKVMVNGKHLNAREFYDEYLNLF